ncbi:MAG: hypothetical protein ACR2LX_09045 [Jatrophihabitans sp.]
MDDEPARRIRPRWPALTRTTVRLLPTLFSDAEAEIPRVHSHRHLELVEQLAGDPEWAALALHACLTHLLTSTVTEAARVRVVDAWIEPDDDGLCIVYRPPHDEGRVVGLRRCRRAATEPGGWRIGDLTTWGYEMRTAAPGVLVDPHAFGWNIADFDVGEPLGYVTTVLRYDRADIGWWGDLTDDLPRPPSAG